MRFVHLRGMSRNLAFIAVLLLCGPAHGAWLRATSEHVEVYGEGSEAALRERVRKLERMHALLSQMLPVREELQRPRYRLYLVADVAAYRQALPHASAYAVAQWSATPDGAIALAVSSDAAMRTDDDSLLEQFVQHVLRERGTTVLPDWAALGFAQYFASTELEVVEGAERLLVGMPTDRLRREVVTDWLSLERLFTANPRKLREVEVAPYRGQSWLLVHYLLQDRERWARAPRLFAALRAGTPPEQAVQQSLGMRLSELRQALLQYMRYGLVAMRLDMQAAAPEITVSTLPASADALLPAALTFEFARLDRETTERVRRTAARFPGDALALEFAALAEVASGQPQRALDLLQPLLGEGATSRQCQLAGHAQRALAVTLPAGQAREDAFVAAANLFARAVRIDPLAYPALYRYYLLRTRSGELPDTPLQDVLVRAYELSPRTSEIALATGRMLLLVGRMPEARAVLLNLSVDPLAGPLAVRAEQLLAYLDGLPPGARPGAAEVDAAMRAAAGAAAAAPGAGAATGLGAQAAADDGQG